VTRRRLVLLLAAAAVAVAVWYFTTGRGSEVCTVCQSDQGRTRCETAAANTPADAVAEARRAACGGQAACLAQPPTSVQCRTR
jgi:hypothetical protein